MLQGTCSRREFVRISLVSLAATIAGCSSIDGGETPPSSPHNNSTSSATETREREKPGLVLLNYSNQIQVASITIVENSEPTSDKDNPYTPTAETPPNKEEQIFTDQQRLEPEGRHTWNEVFPITEEETEYYVFVELNSGATAAHAFSDRPNSGFRYFEITIHSEEEVEMNGVYE